MKIKTTFERRTHTSMGFQINGEFSSLESAMANSEHSAQVTWEDIENNNIKEYTEVNEYRDDENWNDFYFIADHSLIIKQIWD